MKKAISRLVNNDNFWKLIIVILLVLITYAQYFLIIPIKAEVVENKRRIYETILLVEKYQARNNVMFENIMSKLDKL